MVGSTAQYPCRVEEAKAVKAVENRGDGTKTGSGSAHLEAAAEMSQREWTLRQRTTEGRSLEIPGEASDGGRKPLLEAEMVASEKVTSKYMRVLETHSKE
jgi:hypothetical protein